MRKLIAPLTMLLLLLCLALALGACNGNKTAATPQQQAQLDTSAKLIALSGDFVSTSNTYVTRCGARALPVALCNEFSMFSAKFKADYQQAVTDWKAGKDVNMAAANLRDDLKIYTDRAK